VTLRGLARLYLACGNMQAADIRFRQALGIRKGALGDSHPDTAESLVDLASLAHQAGDPVAAEVLYRQALEVRRECLGESHPATAANLRGLAMVVWGRGDAAAAAEMLEKTLAPLEEDHPERLPLRHTLALVCNARGEPGRALELLGQVLKATEKALGEEHDELMPVLGDLARVHAGLGDHLGARQLLERIRAIRARSPLPQPLNEALDLVNLSSSHLNLHNPDRAGDLAGRALVMARAHLPAEEPNLLGFLTKAAGACRSRRRFRAAAGLLVEAEGLVRRVGGARHPWLAGVWTEQGHLEVARGLPRRATPLYERAADLARLSLGEDHPDHAGARRLLGLHLQSLGEHCEAEAQLRRHLEITRRTGGADHPLVALALQALAELHREHGDLASAETLCRQALVLIRRSEHSVDALHASQLHALAVLQRLQGRLPEAAEQLEQALEIDRDSAGGEEGPAHLGTQQELALVEAGCGACASALGRLLRVLSARESLVGAFGCLPAGPFRDALLVAPWNLVEQVLTLAPQVPGSAAEVLPPVLHWNALPPAELAVGDRAALRRRYPADADAMDRLFALNLQVAGRLINGAGLEGLPMHRELLSRWSQERERLEGDLAVRIPSLARLRAWRAARPAAVRGALPPGGTLVELVRFRPRNFAELCAGREGPLPARYLAFVLHADEESVAMVEAGAAGALESGEGVEALRVELAPHLAGRRHVVVGGVGRLKRAAFRRLAPRAEVRPMRSGREAASGLLALPLAGWLARVRCWLAG
jgi:tetratricopeptide (TPR) repeat protein